MVDKFGRDIYSRVIIGGQRTILMSVFAVVLGSRSASLWAFFLDITGDVSIAS